MIRLRLTSRALGSTRFAVSPMMETAVALQYPWSAPRTGQARPAWARAACDPRSWAQLRCLPELLNGGGASIATGEHEPAYRIPEPLLRLLDEMSPSPVRSPLGAVLRAVHRAVLVPGGTAVQALAADFETFFELCLAQHWSAIEPRLEADILERSRLLARGGLAATLATLHPTVGYRSGVLSITHEIELDADWDHGLTLVPSALARRCFVALDHRERFRLCLVYPAAARITEPAEQDGVLGDVVGHTRLRLLRGIEIPSTTAGLAQRHHLSPSTVSYHLGRLHRAGLLARYRDGGSVLYRRTPEADRLLAGGVTPAIRV
ncbi:DUF5937 family protein [Amycolatopsis ultiminotia]|uniref:DUF5937 family protein n=1 Tax=Amycolatopsis ultiminotia TaxID=543629 RepID=UPI0031E9C4B1